ncbi:MAG: cheB [Verrucomicrobiales bacterium]|nr:cheB [Verrucomicrobiales bacterium]
MKIAIVNDLPMATEVLRRILTSSPKYKVVWMAKNGREAIDFCTKERPDLILMDIMMPVMDGVEATRRIMQNCPCPILVVSAHNDDSSKVFEAMGAGALDAIPLPTLGFQPNASGPAQLLAKIDLMARDYGQETVEKSFGSFAPADREDSLIVIGASAGGPAALAAVLKGLPANFPAPIIIVQHLSEEFTAGLVDWLNTQSVLKVRIAKEGDQPIAGEVLVAGGSNHLIFTSATKLGYTEQPSDCIHRPSIDVFLKSVAQRWSGVAIGVLLTGMGRDGAAGLKMMRNKGYLTIAQDKETSVVYGMPKAAATMEAATEILPLDKIAPHLKKVLRV